MERQQQINCPHVHLIERIFLNKLILLLWLQIGVINHLPLHYLNIIQVNFFFTARKQLFIELYIYSPIILLCHFNKGLKLPSCQLFLKFITYNTKKNRWRYNYFIANKKGLKEIVLKTVLAVGNSLAVQWSGLRAFTTKVPGSIPGQGTKTS